MHADALRAAREAMKQAEPWSEFWDDNDADALVRAAITAFLGHVKVSEDMVIHGNNFDGYGICRMWEAMLSQLAREL